MCIGTSEGLRLFLALALHSRDRFIINLLPLLQRATALRRVVTVACGGKEGRVDAADFEGWNVSMFSARGHLASLITLSLEALAKKAPDVSFIHDFPGPVKTGIGRDAGGLAMLLLKAVFTVIGPFVYIPNEECGERHLFVATSARYPPATGGNAGVQLESTAVVVARGIDGKDGSGVYSIDWDGESASTKVILDNYRKEGMVEKIWKYLEEEYIRITGQKSI